MEAAASHFFGLNSALLSSDTRLLFRVGKEGKDGESAHRTDLEYPSRREYNEKNRPCDSERVDDIASSHMRAGYGKIGKVEIDCKYNFRKSK